MNYILIMTEGPDELAFIYVLIEKGIIKFDISELLYEKPYHARKLDTSLCDKINTLDIEDKITIYRVGDKLTDKLKCGEKYVKARILDVIDVCTLPEFEILMIINENKYEDFIKNKSKLSPSEFYKSINKKYNKQSKFITDYFGKMNSDQIVQLLNKYVELRGKTHSKCQKTLLELIKQ